MNENTVYPNYRRLSVAKLPPSAARLLLALSAIEPNESPNSAMKRSGIREIEKYLAAYEYLEQHGFIVIRDGQVYITMYTQEERITEPVATMPRPGVVTRITNAKQ